MEHIQHRIQNIVGAQHAVPELQAGSKPARCKGVRLDDLEHQSSNHVPHPHKHTKISLGQTLWLSITDMVLPMSTIHSSISVVEKIASKKSKNFIQYLHKLQSLLAFNRFLLIGKT